ncbi:MAG: fused MFS/spermidine synthase [Verrucomicrobia bacterium]|nr:fused MFS/spermidine synthase [Verrucomicrobiota bacterium]
MNYIFCLVSLLGAFLLFQVQPMISKFILPWFGGSPGVWTTCMLFFQVVLFGGYSYAHLLTRRKAVTQAWLHMALLALAAALLPIVPDASFKPSGSENPAWNILLLLLATVGLPYFMLSATSPLVQVWYSRVYPNRTPWRLYALSNAGSLTALLSYPILIEPRWDVMSQAWIWSGSFVLFALLMGACAVGEWKRGTAEAARRLHEQEILDATAPGPDTWRRVRWILLPAFASLMLLATTNHVCQNVAVIPFLWVVPLALYLVTFIICFDHPRWYRRALLAVPAMLAIILTSGLHEIFPDWTPGFVVELVIYFSAMFLICMVCHGELARLKPGTSHLTEYYLLMSAGGALGGLAVSLVAPQVFSTYMEWSLGLAGGFVLVAWVAYRGLVAGGSARARLRIGAAIAVISLAGMYFIVNWEFLSFSSAVARSRSFYGTLRVSARTDDQGGKFHSFYCSGTEHGRQYLDPARRRDPLTYYGRESGIGMVLDGLKSMPDAKVGIIGMGTATVACYAERGQTYRFYEINPIAVDMARKWFTFIDDLQARGAKYELVLGDARLSLEHEAAHHFDVLMLDAFSGDSVPVHLLTREAFEIYQRHLKPDGVIAVHITNRYLNLAPVVERVAREFGYLTTRQCIPNDLPGHYQPDYLLLSKDGAFIRAHPPVPPVYARDLEVPLWTDHAHNLFQILQSS